MARNDIPPGLIKWAYRDEWREALEATLDDHFLPVCDEFDLEEDRLHEILGDRASAALWGCAFEDFATQPDEETGDTFIDAYLKRRGWKETVTTRRFLEALRDSVLSLHLVVEATPADSFVVQDLILGGEPVRIFDAEMSRLLKPGTTVALRVLDIGGRHRFSGSVLPFDEPSAQALLARIESELDEMRQAVLAEADPADLETLEQSEVTADNLMKAVFLVGAPALFSFVWMEHFLDTVPDEARTRPAEPASRKLPPAPRGGGRDWD